MPDFNAKMHQNQFGCGSAPDPAGGAYSAPPDPLAGFKGAYFKGEGRGRQGRGQEGRGGKGRRGEGTGGNGTGGKGSGHPQIFIWIVAYATFLLISG